MKKFLKSKILLVLILSQFLTSCVLTRGIWEGGSYDLMGGQIAGFFIDQENNRVVLVSRIDRDNPSEHYSITEPTGKLLKVFELAQKSQDTNFEMDGSSTKGSKVMGGFWIGFRNQNLSKEDVKFLKEEGLVKKNKEFFGRFLRFDNDEKRKDSYRWYLAKTTRYPSSQEPLKNLCSYEPAEYKTIPLADEEKKSFIPKEPKQKLIAQPKPKSSNSPNCVSITVFDSPWKGIVEEHYTAGQQVKRVVLTPFAIVADIVLIPIYAIGVIGMGVGGK